MMGKGIRIFSAASHARQLSKACDQISTLAATCDGGAGEIYHSMLTSLINELGAMGGMIGRLTEDQSTIHPICYLINDKIQSSIACGLADMPCQKIYLGEPCIFPKAVQKLFPNDLSLKEFGVEGYAGIPLFDRSGKVAGVLALLFADEVDDIVLVDAMMRIFATRIMAEMDRQKADAQKAEHESLLDRARDAIFVFSADYTIRYWNRGAERMYGLSAADVIGQKANELFFQESPTYGKAYREVMENGEWKGEIHQRDCHGAEQVVESCWNRVKDESGETFSIYATHTDITEHRHLEQQFIRAQRLESIGTMAGGLAHDLNNILAPISMAVELLKSRVFDDRGQELLNSIGDSAKRGAEMIKQVVAFSQGIEGQRIEVHPKQLVSEIVKIGRDTFFKGIFCQARVSHDLWTVRGDSTQLHQVLLNLCINARDATQEGGKVVIRATNQQVDETFCATAPDASSGPYVCISVEDNGTGISSDLLEKIFDPFFTTKAVGKGTGLGLPTSMAIVKSHGGFMRVKSKTGQGTSFRVFLPALSIPDSEPAPTRPLLRGQGQTILIVDDEESILQITQQALEANGYRALLAYDGREAVAIYSEHQAEIAGVILDMRMPVMNGQETIAVLTEMDPDVKIVAVSGISSYEETAFESGSAVKFFLAKPYTAETLLNVLTGLTNNGIGTRSTI